MLKRVLSVFFVMFSIATSGTIVGVVGDVHVNGKSAKIGMLVNIGDSVVTSEESSCDIRVLDRTGIRIKEKSRVVITEAYQGSKKSVPKTRIALIKGYIISLVRKDSDFEIRTPTATAAVRGTIFFSQHTEGEDYFCTCNGDVEYKNSKGEQRDVHAIHHSGISIDKNGVMKSAGMLNHNDSEIFELMSSVGY